MHEKGVWQGQDPNPWSYLQKIVTYFFFDKNLCRNSIISIFRTGEVRMGLQTLGIAFFSKRDTWVWWWYVTSVTVASFFDRDKRKYGIMTAEVHIYMAQVLHLLDVRQWGNHQTRKKWQMAFVDIFLEPLQYYWSDKTRLLDVVSTKDGKSVDCVCLSPSRFSEGKKSPYLREKSSINAFEMLILAKGYIMMQVLMPVEVFYMI